MSRLIATRITDEQYSKIMGKCSGLGRSVYDYLKMLVETDIGGTKDEAKRARSQEIDKRIEEISKLLDDAHRRSA
jgi:hypothetical protein